MTKLKLDDGEKGELLRMVHNQEATDLLNLLKGMYSNFPESDYPVQVEFLIRILEERQELLDAYLEIKRITHVVI